MSDISFPECEYCGEVAYACVCHEADSDDATALIEILITDGMEALAVGGLHLARVREAFRCALAHVEYNTKYGMPGPDQKRVTSTGFSSPMSRRRSGR